MEANIKKWGNSAGIIIPQPFLKACELSIGDSVDILEESGSIIIKPISGPSDLTALEKQIINLTKDLSSEDRKQLILKIGTPI